MTDVKYKTKLLLIAALAFVVVAGSMTSDALSRSSKTGAVVGGLIAGAAIGAAISSANHPTTVYVEGEVQSRSRINGVNRFRRSPA